ncbi:MAG: hypothetical protein HFG69_15695 [Hungatella sp.]|nr:hypothetical protein [Hungatella sp.]
MTALRVIRYDGWGSIEILPGDNPDEMARSAVQFIKLLING